MSKRELPMQSAWLSIVGSLLAPLAAQATTLWYNGDYNGSDAARNSSKVPINIGGNYFLQTSLVYNDFIVPVGQTWTVTSVFSNNQEAFGAQATNATWEIRTGITPGQGGVIVANGDTAATISAGHAEDNTTGTTYADAEYQIAASVPSVVLAAGVYYLAVAPDSVGYYADQSYIETTSGANAAGLPPGNDGGSYLSMTGPAGADPQSFVLSNLDYSAGVVGTATTIVLPEPASLALGVIGLAALRRRRKCSAERALTNAIEPLESRRHLSHSADIYAHLRHADLNAPSHHDVIAPAPSKVSETVAPTAGKGIAQFHFRFQPPVVKHSPKLVNFTPVSGAYTPTQLRTAYGINALNTANSGQGMTIGIVDEFDDPNILSDTNIFSSHYGLPQFNAAGGPTFTVYKDQALGSVVSAVGTGVAGETSLDVEWAHAIAPLANILLVEVPADGTNNANVFAQLLHGVQYAAAQPKVGAVSLSYGFSEAAIGNANVVSLNNTYLTTGAASQTAITVSSGDGSTPLFPATSPNVTAVGGTSLYFRTVRGAYSFETGWGGVGGAGAGGGGLSTNFASPTYQSAHGVSFSKRAIPDVSLDADPITGVSVYDSLDVTTAAPSPWGETGGTSLSAPLFAGVVTLAQQNRLATNLGLLNSTQVNNDIYTAYNSPAYAATFHDVTLGNNTNRSSSGTVTTTGYATAAGYDLATGVGSPVGNTLVSVLSA